MAIATGLALLGAAALTAGGTALAASSQEKAAKQAANIEANASHEANLLSRDIYNSNVGYLSPWMSTGQTANNAIMELLGYPSQATQQQPSAFTPMASSPYPSAFAGQGNGSGIVAPGGFAWDEPGAFYGRFPRSVYNPMPSGQPVPATGTVTTAAPTARSAFDTYKNSTGYDFRFNEGTRALQSAFSRNLESGAAAKAALRFGQGIASDEFGRYMDLLRGQSQLGLSGASALAGVGQNFADSVNSSNRLAADAAANARLYSGQQNAAMWQGLGSSFGQILGAIPGGGMPSFKVGGW